MPQVVTRFAPSPTGHLHIGGARTAMFCWAYARAQAARLGPAASHTFILRVEDTDQARSSEQAVAGILEDLAWLGIRWDEGPTRSADGIGGDPRAVGPFFQAQRLHIYNAYIDRMIDQDQAYPAFDTQDQIDAARRAAAERKQTFRYTRDPAYDRDAALARLRAGEPCVVRFRNPGTPVHVADSVLGDITFEPEHTDDFVLRKADGFPTYHLAVVIDDELMGVTHILRGQEHLNNTPRHVALQMALRRLDTNEPFRTPVYAHLPLIFNPDGSKMSKRDKDKAARDAARAVPDAPPAALHAAVADHVSPEQFATWLDDKRSQLPTNALVRLAVRLNLDLPEIEVEDFRRSGYLPAVLCNYLALLGWNPGNDLEKFDLDFLARAFDLDRIGKTNSRFDRAKLRAFNADALRALTPEEFARLWRDWARSYEPRLAAIDDARLIIAARAAQPRAATFREAVAQIAFALTGDDAADDAVAFDPAAVEKILRKGQPSGLDILRELEPAVAAIPDHAFAPEAVDDAIKTLAESRSLGLGKVAQPLRVALTGSTVSPGLGDVAAILGRERTLRRIARCRRLHA